MTQAGDETTFIDRDEIVLRIDALLDRPDLRLLSPVRAILLGLQEGCRLPDERRRLARGAGRIMLDDLILANSTLGLDIFSLLNMYRETGRISGAEEPPTGRYIPTSKVTRNELVSDIDSILSRDSDPPSPNLQAIRDELMMMTDADPYPIRRKRTGMIGTLMLIPRIADTRFAMKVCSFLDKYSEAGQL